VGRGYAEGPAVEEAYEASLRVDDKTTEERLGRRAVMGSTPDDPAKHFIGWLDEVDPDELFASGKAWGISVVRRAEA
jgi:hypothetical protein